MVAFARFQDALYLTEQDAANPGEARLGFLFQDAARTDPTFTLSQASWTDPAQQGYFLFLAPSETRDWKLFAQQVRALFTATQSSQFGWFDETGAAPTAATLILVTGQGTATPTVSSPFSLPFGNIALTVQGSPFDQATIAFDDAAAGFTIGFSDPGSIQLTVAPQSTFTSSSTALTLPMAGGTDPRAGSVNAGFAFSTDDLASFEAGIMIFDAGSEGMLGALSFPVLRAPGGGGTALQFSAWLDVLQPLADTRTYFQCLDPLVGSYYTAATGQAFAFTTTGGDAAQASRLVLANRPIRQASDTGTYYLTPAGTFGLAIDGAAAAPAAPDGPAALVCGTAATEFLAVSTAANNTDRLVFAAGYPAYRITPDKNRQSGAPVFMDTQDGNVTTAWAQFVTQDGHYVSQPQETPLYAQAGTETALLAGEAPASGLNVYVLDFLPLPSWSAEHAEVRSTRADGAGEAATPFVPLAPFAGLVFSTSDQAAPYREAEATAINPTRRTAFTAAGGTVSARRRERGEVRAAAPADDLTYAMTPLGLLAGLEGTGAQQVWQTTGIAISPALDNPAANITLQLTAMGDEIRNAFQQNQIFIVASTLTGRGGDALFDFAGTDQQVNIAGWPFSLSPAGTPADDGTPPLLLFKFYPGLSIKDLVADTNLWSQADIFNGTGFTATQAQTYIQGLIQNACEAVYGAGKCPDGTPTGQPDTSSLYYNFYTVVTDPNWSGMLALNANMQLNNLPTAIKAVTGGMTYAGDDGKPVSNIGAFRVHHVGVAINDTAPDQPTPTLSQSALFGLVDYEKPAASTKQPSGLTTTISYNFEVEYLRALFTNAALDSFSCQINLTINDLFGTPVSETSEGRRANDDTDNVVVITGSYQANSTSGNDSSSGEGLYSFVSEKTFEFAFGTNPYLDKISLTKLQFSFLQETADAGGGDISTINASFGIWGSLVFKEFDVLDIFSFKQLVFNDLGISVRFDLTVPPPPTAPSTANIALAFNPGNLRLDLAASEPKEGKNSLLSLLPFKLTSFLYNQYPDQQTVEDVGYYALSEVPLDPGFSLTDMFTYGLTFELDLGRLGALVGSLEAFKFGFLIGWGPDNGASAGGIAFGVQLPQADGKLQIQIEGVLNLLIEQFILRYETPEGGTDPMLVLVLHNSSLEVLGQRLPPGEAQFDFALFAPANDSARIGWIAAINNEPKKEDGRRITGQATRGTAILADPEPKDEGGAFQLLYLGIGQRVGPSAADTPTDFAGFLEFMTGAFWDAIEAKEYDKVYHPDQQWLALTDFKLLDIIQVGFVFYDGTPFYSLTLNVEKFFNFEITYTKISDSIGLFFANFALPDNLRTFQVGAASLTLPSLAVSVYTNGDWKLDLGFPNGDDWTRCFQVQAQAGPVPVTGSGGFYIANLSSATSNVFVGTYASIIAFGFAARMGVGKDFTAGPLKAGVSVTFFGIIEGAAGYHLALSTDIFQRPDALMLQGQFGVIGELYGSIDFVIIKASVNVRLQASIGIVLKWEPAAGNDGSILLYIQASVSVSVSVEIDLFLFSITISFSFNASFRFDWQLAGPAQAHALSDMRWTLLAARTIAANVTTLPLIPAFNAALPIWYTPEGTIVFPSSAANGTPWVVTSLALEYDPQPAGAYGYADFKPFEQVATQLSTWAVGQALGRSGWNYTIAQTELAALDQDPELLLQGIDYAALLAQLAVFSASAVIVPSAPAGTTLYAATFPMLPFIQLQTTGRMSGTNAADLNYVFSSKNPVPADYIAAVDAYFAQLFVNQSSAAQGVSAAMLSATADATTPLIQEIFYDYMSGLIRGAVHQLLETMQNAGQASATIDAVTLQAVTQGLFANLSGQISSSFRGGVRLPYTAGLTVPDGAASTTTNALYALLWQEFPVGDLGSSGKYTISLGNSDATQNWLTVQASWDLTATWLATYQNVAPGSVAAPETPTQLPFTDLGPRAFAFQNAIAWTQPSGTVASLRPFPPSLQTLQVATAANIATLVQSRPAGAPYMPGGTPLPASGFVWATEIALTVTQVPGDAGAPLPDIFALSGSSQQDEQLLEQILALPDDGSPIASIQILYQTAAGSSGLTSKAITPADVFVLRTNTTTVSAPPRAIFLAEVLAAPPAQVPVGAAIDDVSGFLQIVQQAAVTNATGYYLRYRDTAGDSLPPTLFTGGPATLTILISYNPDGSANTPASPAQVCPYYNAISIANADPSLVYYAETTDPALAVQYGTVAPGCIGIVTTRSDSVSLIKPTARLHAMTRNGLLSSTGLHRRSDLIAALAQSGVEDEAEMRALVAEAGGTASTVNALYSLITYQVAPTAGFIASNLSAPIQPQQPTLDTSLTDGIAADADTRSYRIYVPLYSLATANQPVPPLPNRYASIPSPVSVSLFQNDCFGNQMPTAISFSATNYYFDPIVPFDQWQGIVSAYDFDSGAGALTVYLTPSEAAFASLSADQIAASLQSWTTIQDQVTAPGISFVARTNLALQSDGAAIEVTLYGTQAASLTAMVGQIVGWLQDPAAPFPVKPVALTVGVAGPGDLPPAFAIQVILGIARDPALISPLLKDGSGAITFPPAQRIDSTIAPTVGGSLADGSSVSLPAFARRFVAAFPALALSVGLGDAPSGGGSGKQPLWAVQQVLLGITIGNGAGSGPFYASPMPLDNQLNSATVPMPTLPKSLQPPNWPTNQLFTNVDLDTFNSSFFAAVDNMLAPASAAAAFEKAPAAYRTIAEGRATIASLYSANEIDWLFAADAPFTGSATQMDVVQEAFGQQMRAALATAYSTDTIVQYAVNWTGTVPASVGDLYELYGTVQSSAESDALRGFTISAPHVPIAASGPSVLTFLFGVSDVKDIESATLDLTYSVTHIQHFLEPASQTPAGEARASIWLQLVEPVPSHIGPAATSTTIPLVFRQYPTPPTMILQKAIAGSAVARPAGANPLTEAAAWYLQYAYQAQFTVHDLILTSVTYNSDLTASGGGPARNLVGDGDGPVYYTLFEALARFAATYAILQPVLADLTNPSWADAAASFAELVEGIVHNTSWTPLPQTLARVGGLQHIVDTYQVDDVALSVNDSRQITLSWTGAQSSFAGATLSILALAPQTLAPYPNQTQESQPQSITDTYMPVPPLADDWIIHQIEVDHLSVLEAENALASVQIERNRITMTDGDGQSWSARNAFVYMTPVVSATQPITPFVDNGEPIDIATLPNQGIATGCPQAPPAGVTSLCQRIYTMMYDLLADAPTLERLLGARAAAGQGTDAPRRMKLACGFQYQVASAAGITSANPISPVIPVALARSFLIDGNDPAQLGDFSALFPENIAGWLATNQIGIGIAAQAGARLVFDLTLYAELSGVNMPVLRLRQLELRTADIAA